MEPQFNKDERIENNEWVLNPGLYPFSDIPLPLQIPTSINIHTPASPQSPARFG